MDDAAAGKALAFQQVLHHLVVGVGVGAQALAVLQTPGNDIRCHALALARRGQPVDGSVGQGVVEPLAALDLCIGGVRPQNEGEHRLKPAVDRIDEQPVGVDVLFQHLSRRIAVAPLGRVARSSHHLPGTGIDV